MEINKLQIGDATIHYSENKIIEYEGNEKKLIIPEVFTEIYGSVFEKCSDLVEIQFEADEVILGSCCFDECKNLERVIVGKNGSGVIIEIGNCCFYDCFCLKELPISLHCKIGYGAFTNCENIKVPVEQFEDIAWENILDSDVWKRAKRCMFCNKSDSIITMELGQKMKCSNCGKEWNKKEFDHMYHFMIQNNEVKYVNTTEPIMVIPKGVTSIADSVFDDASVWEIECPDSIKTIGNGAFFWCDMVHRIYLPRGLERLESQVLEGASMEYINLPEKLKYIGHKAMFNLPNVKEVELPDSVKVISMRAFEYCESLRKIDLNEGLEYIGERAFANCSSLRKITIPKTVKTIGQEAFEGCDDLREINLQEGLLYIGSRTFKGCELLKKIVIPKSVVSIAPDAFEGCEARIYRKS